MANRSPTLASDEQTVLDRVVVRLVRSTERRRFDALLTVEQKFGVPECPS